MHSRSSGKDLGFLTLTAAKMSAAELGLGTFLHAFRVPMRGHALSVNQGLFLSQVAEQGESRWQAARNVLEVSGITSTLKSLSPAGSTLGPMISILVQGALYSLGICIFGRGWMGRSLGMALLCPWAFFQSMLTLGLIFGPDLFRDLIRLFSSALAWTGLPETSWKTLLCLIVGLKILVGVLLQSFRVRPGGVRASIIGQVPPPGERTSPGAFRAAVHDLTRPLFLFSLGVTVLFSVLNRSSHAQIVWVFLRPVGVGFLFFLILRSRYLRVALRTVCMKSKLGEQFYQRAREVARVLAGD